MASLTDLQAQRGQLLAEIAVAEDAQSNAIKAKFDAQRKLDFGGSQLTAQRRTELQAQVTQANAEISAQGQRLTTLEAQLAQVDAQIADLQALQTLPVQSTGSTTKQAQNARDDGASATDPPSESLVAGADGRVRPAQARPPTNAQAFRPNNDVGTNAVTKKNINTQSTPAITAPPGSVPPTNRDDTASQTIGICKPGDDNTNTAANDVQQTLNKIFGAAQKIISQPNPLDKYASYTYNISLYLMTPRQYKQLLTTQQKNIPGMNLLMQSGGAPQGSITPGSQIDPNIELPEQAQQASLQTLGRNQFFPLDFYIDDLQLKSLVQNKGSQTSSNVFEMTFKIIEPNGISLLDRLWLATKNYVDLENLSTGVAGAPAQTNYAAQNYLMVIKFYGYDDAGNLVRPTTNTNPTGGTDKDAVIEKWIPFQFTGIRFRVANKLTEYECAAVCPMNRIATSQMRGVIPYNVELTATTLKELLNGTAGFSATANQNSDPEGRQSTTPSATAPGSRNSTTATSDTSAFTNVDQIGNFVGAADTSVDTQAGATATQSAAPPKANSAPKPSTKTVITGLVEALNQYQKEITTGPNAPFTYPDVYDIIIQEPVMAAAKIVPPGQLDKTQQAMAPNTPDQKLGSKQSVNNDAQNKSIVAGTSILQVIDLAVRQSEYITKQQNIIIDPVTWGPKPTAYSADTVAWYHVGAEAEPMQYDPKRQDYAYRITYRITPYAISDPQSDWFPFSQYRGTQKQYPYWFTGQNTQVLDLSTNYNYMYYLVANGPSPRNLLTDYRELIPRGYQTRSNETAQGNTGKTFEPGANLAGSLYSPADTVRTELTIVGDPDWIQQGEILYGLPRLVDYAAFYKDGSINYESQEPLFEILFNTPVDYDLGTGIMDPGQKNYNANRKNGIPGEASTSYVYRAIQCDSIFSRGKFTQRLSGAQVFFPAPKQNTAVQKNQDTQEARPATNNVTRNPINVKAALANASPAVQTATKATDWAQDFRTTPGQGTNTQSVAAQLANQSVLPGTPALPPTSGGQVIGAVSSQAIINQSGGATGTNVGQPVTVTVPLTDGGSQQITSSADIQNLRQQGLIDPFAANSAANRLRLLQTAANNPITTAPRPVRAIEK